MDEFRPAVKSAALGLLLLAGSSCGSPPALTNTLESDESLARVVLDAVARNDAQTLLRVAVTKDEFEDIVWPTLPVSRPEVGMPMDYIWQDTFTKSRAYLAQTLGEFGGKRFELIEVEFHGETTASGTFTASRKTHLRVKDETGQPRTIRLFGSIIRQNRRSKVSSYIID